MTLVSQQEAPSGDLDPVPQVVASYAAYLQARTRAVPEATITGEHAELALTIAGRTLVLAFAYRGREWSMHHAEVRRGEQAAAFTRGQLARAVTALLEPLAGREDGRLGALAPGARAGSAAGEPGPDSD